LNITVVTGIYILHTQTIKSVLHVIILLIIIVLAETELIGTVCFCISTPRVM